MSERPVFGITPPPSCSRERRRTQHNERMLAAGVHPVSGEPLLPAEQGGTCGTCLHRTQWGHTNGTYFKCRASRMTGGPATDIRLKWPACALYEPADGYAASNTAEQSSV